MILNSIGIFKGKLRFYVKHQSLVYFAIDKHSTAANRNHTMYESIKTKRRDAEVAEERREKQAKTSIKTQKRQYNEKVKTFLCAPLRSLRLCVGKETEIFMLAGYVYLRLRCYKVFKILLAIEYNFIYNISIFIIRDADGIHAKLCGRKTCKIFNIRP